MLGKLLFFILAMLEFTCVPEDRVGPSVVGIILEILLKFCRNSLFALVNNVKYLEDESLPYLYHHLYLTNGQELSFLVLPCGISSFW